MHLYVYERKLLGIQVPKEHCSKADTKWSDRNHDIENACWIQHHMTNISRLLSSFYQVFAQLVNSPLPSVIFTWTDLSVMIQKKLMSLQNQELLWVELCISERYVEALTSGTCECGLLWEKGLCRHNQVKTRLYWIRVGSKFTDQYPYQEAT